MNGDVPTEVGCIPISPQSVNVNEDGGGGGGGTDIQKLLLEQPLKKNGGMTQFSPGLNS